VGQLHGVGAFQGWVGEVDRRGTTFAGEIQEARAVGAARVLVRGDWGNTGHGSGLEIASNFCRIFTVRSGQIKRVEYFQACAEALKAVGLEE